MEKLYSKIEENTFKTFIESSIANIQEHKYKKIEKLKSNKQKEKLSYRCYLLFLFVYRTLKQIGVIFNCIVVIYTSGDGNSPLSIIASCCFWMTF